MLTRLTTRTQTKPPQHLHPHKLVELQEENDGRCSRFAQYQFYTHMLDNWHKEKAQKPPTECALIPSHYFFADTGFTTLLIRNMSASLEYLKPALPELVNGQGN